MKKDRMVVVFDPGATIDGVPIEFAVDKKTIWWSGWPEGGVTVMKVSFDNMDSYRSKKKALLSMMNFEDEIPDQIIVPEKSNVLSEDDLNEIMGDFKAGVHHRVSSSVLKGSIEDLKWLITIILSKKDVSFDDSDSEEVEGEEISRSSSDSGHVTKEALAKVMREKLSGKPDKYIKPPPQKKRHLLSFFSFFRKGGKGSKGKDPDNQEKTSKKTWWRK